ncbi:flagellin [Pseudodesulfovibrio tunisiensis]|uniref:flagellin n=1 Tax=Pseudodesulfovibrio tunisiensis TaxID=463192 RepID=UPI001FB22A78|nr:flagellin [Pseudodesulfovibrio tunisiensis]
MALSDVERQFIYNYSMQLLQQDILTNSLFAGSSVGRDLRSMVLAKQPVQPLTNPFEAAITGTLRGDAAQVRQSSRNVQEAASMVGTARTGVAQIADALSDMEDLIDKINSGELDQTSAVVQSDYDALRDKIEGLVSSTDYNGIAMLDSSQWGTNQIDSNGNVYIQSTRDGGFDVTFHAMDDIDWSQLIGSQLDDSGGGDRAAQLALVQNYQGQVDAILDVYEKKEDSLNSQVLHLESQAQVIDQAVAARSPETTNSVEQLLLNLLLKETGTVVDESS